MTRQVQPPGSEPRRWANERDNSLSNVARRTAIGELELAQACAPRLADDVENHAARIGIRIGCGKGRALRLCDTGLFLRKMPKIAELVLSRGCFSFSYVYAMAMSVYALADEHREAVEEDILEYLHPARDGQSIPGMRTFKRTLCDIVGHYDELGVNDDETPTVTATGEGVSYYSASESTHSEISAVLRADRAAEFMSVLTGIRHAETKAGRPCTWGDAMMHLARGSAQTKVVLNVYRHQDGGPVWGDGMGWLSAVAQKQWLSRVTDIRVSADSSVSGYVPTEAQVARVRGRDGTCRFPGCDVPAHRCDLDHIQSYDHDNPQLGGPTDTQNLHCLCRKHHNLKTSRLWEVKAHADNTETWSSCDGQIVANSVPSGPMAGFGRQTFDQRVTRTTQTIRERNITNQLLHDDAKQAILRSHELAVGANGMSFDPSEFREADRYFNKLERFEADRAKFADAMSEGWPISDLQEPEPPF